MIHTYRLNSFCSSLKFLQPCSHIRAHSPRDPEPRQATLTRDGQCCHLKRLQGILSDASAPRQPGSPGPRQAWPEAPTAGEAAGQRAGDAGPAGVALPGQGLDLGLGLEGEEDDALDAWGEEEVDRELARMKMELGIEVRY